MQIKRLIIIIFLALLAMSAPIQGFAQVSSNTTTTRVGNPTTLPPSSGDGSSILVWAQRINDALEPALWDYRNKMMADICNDSGYCAHKRLGISDSVDQLTLNAIYWCTFIVVDSYNLAGKTGLTPGAHLAVVNMIKFFKSTSGYFYLDYQNGDRISILLQVRPGQAYFLVSSPELVHTGSEHTGLVKSIQVDQYGNGSLVTVESNSSYPGHTYPIVEGEVINTHYPLRGFGGMN